MYGPRSPSSSTSARRHSGIYEVRRVARESIPHVKLGGRVLFRLADVVAWSQEREVAAPVSQSPRSTAKPVFAKAEEAEA